MAYGRKAVLFLMFQAKDKGYYAMAEMDRQTMEKTNAAIQQATIQIFGLTGESAQQVSRPWKNREFAIQLTGKDDDNPAILKPPRQKQGFFKRLANLFTHHHS